MCFACPNLPASSGFDIQECFKSKNSFESFSLIIKSFHVNIYSGDRMLSHNNKWNKDNSFTSFEANYLGSLTVLPEH